MHLVMLHIAIGSAFFTGMLLVSTCIVPALWLGKRPSRKILGALAALGFMLVIVSNPPMSPLLYITWVAIVASAFMLMTDTHIAKKLVKAKPFVAALLFALSSGLCIAEARYRFLPDVYASPSLKVHIVGDSLSSGIGSGVTLWPSIYARLSGRKVVNLARSGATLHAALLQAAKLPDAPGIVILEIGGNDLFSCKEIFNSQGSMKFRNDLDRLLGSVKREGRLLIMFELPLPPFHGAFGEAQRSLAAEYGVTLIPRRYLGAVLNLEGGTLDGLHFSQIGHDAMAELMARVIQDTRPESE
jgi:acyl-CoA thioesterase-1